MAAIDGGSSAVSKLTGEVCRPKAVSAFKVVGQGHDLQQASTRNTPAGVYPAVLVTYESLVPKGLDSGRPRSPCPSTL